MDIVRSGRRSAKRATPMSVGSARTPKLLLWMGLAIGVVAVVAYWDAQREFAAALRDFAGEQTALAQTTSIALRSQLAQAWVAPIADPTTRLELERRTREFLASMRSVERPHLVRVLVQTPLGSGLSTSD